MVSSLSPLQRDRARQRARSLTTAAAVAGGALTVAGAAVAAGTFSGHTASAASQPNLAPVPTDSGGLQPPDQAPQQPAAGDVGSGPIVSGGS